MNTRKITTRQQLVEDITEEIQLMTDHIEIRITSIKKGVKHKIRYVKVKDQF